MAPGLDKLNRAGLGASSFGTRKTTGMSAQATKNLANSSPATKSSLFSFKGSRMANFVPGRNISENMHKYNYQNQRAALNGGAQRTYSPRSAGHVHSTGMNNIGTVQYNNTSYQNGMATANLLLGGMQLLNQMGVFNGGDGVKSSSLGEKLGDAFSSIGGSGDVSTFSGQLSGTTTFNNLNKLESNVNAKKASLASDYQALDPKTDMQGIIDGAQEGLNLAEVNLDIDSLSLTNLDSNNLEQCITNIEADIAKIGNFKTNQLPAAKNQITTKAGQIKGTISAKEGELSSLELNNKDGCNSAAIAQLKQDIENLKQQQEQLKKAEDAIQQLSTECENSIKDLETKEAEVKDIKKFEDNIKDKKYDMAKSQDKELKQTLAKLKKLDADIAKASIDKNGGEYNKKDEKREEKLNKLTAERNTLFSSMSKLMSSLSAAGDTTFENSKGSTYTIANLDEAMKYKPAETSS